MTDTDESNTDERGSMADQLRALAANLRSLAEDEVPAAPTSARVVDLEEKLAAKSEELRLMVERMRERDALHADQLAGMRSREVDARGEARRTLERLRVSQTAAHDARDELRRTASILGLPDPLPAAPVDDFTSRVTEDFQSARANLAAELVRMRNGRVVLETDHGDMEVTALIKRLKARVVELEAKLAAAERKDDDPMSELLGLAQKFFGDLGQK